MQIKKSVQKWVVKLAGRGDKNSTTEDFTAREKTWGSAVPQEQPNPQSARRQNYVDFRNT